MSKRFEKLTRAVVEFFPSEVKVVTTMHYNGSDALAYGTFEFLGWFFELEVAHDGFVRSLVVSGNETATDEGFDELDSVLESIARAHASLVRIAEGELAE